MNQIRAKPIECIPAPKYTGFFVDSILQTRDPYQFFENFHQERTTCNYHLRGSLSLVDCFL